MSLVLSEPDQKGVCEDEKGLAANPEMLEGPLGASLSSCVEVEGGSVL